VADPRKAFTVANNRGVCYIQPLPFWGKSRVDDVSGRRLE
jgi:hypothetical protein